MAINVPSNGKDESRSLNNMAKVQPQGILCSALDKIDEAKKLLLGDRFLKSVKKGIKDTFIYFLQVESSLEWVTGWFTRSVWYQTAGSAHHFKGVQYFHQICYA